MVVLPANNDALPIAVGLIYECQRFFPHYRQSVSFCLRTLNDALNLRRVPLLPGAGFDALAVQLLRNGDVGLAALPIQIGRAHV